MKLGPLSELEKRKKFDADDIWTKSVIFSIYRQFGAIPETKFRMQGPKFLFFYYKQLFI